MATYENQSDMFEKRAKKCKKNGDKYYSMAMEAKEKNDIENYKKYIAQSQHYYKSQKENEEKAKEHKGKKW